MESMESKFLKNLNAKTFFFKDTKLTGIEEQMQGRCGKIDDINPWTIM